MLPAAMASDRNPDSSKDEVRDDFMQQEPGRASSGESTRTQGRRILEDEYDDDDEDNEDEEELRRRERRARAARRAARSRKPRIKLNIPTTEEQLNVPKFQTIGLLGSVSLLMVIMWFAARLACNAHPDHIRDPRYVSVDQLARDPKNAALEFQLRFVSKDVLLAGELVTGKMADSLRELIRACEGNTDGCGKERDALKNKVTGTANLLEMSPASAVVEVTTYISNVEPSTSVLDLVPVGQVWKVSQSRPRRTAQPAADPMAPQVDPAGSPPP